MFIVWEYSEFSKKLLSYIFLHYRRVIRTQSKIYDGLFILVKIVKPKSSIVDIWRGSKYASALVMSLSRVFFCFSTFMGK